MEGFDGFLLKSEAFKVKSRPPPPLEFARNLVPVEVVQLADVLINVPDRALKVPA